jgi:hypothetical protein
VSRVIATISALVGAELLTAAPSDRAALNQGKRCAQKVRICVRQMVRKLREAIRIASLRKTACVWAPPVNSVWRSGFRVACR